MVERGTMLLILAVILTGVVAAGAAEAQVGYLGDFCWDVRASGSDASRLQLGILSVGPAHVLMAGRLTRPGSGPVEPVHGNAELVGTSALLTLVASSGAPTGLRQASTYRVVLNLADLGGTYKMVGLVGGLAPPEVVTEDGTLTALPCQ